MCAEKQNRVNIEMSDTVKYGSFLNFVLPLPFLLSIPISAFRLRSVCSDAEMDRLAPILQSYSFSVAFNVEEHIGALKGTVVVGRGNILVHPAI